MSEREDVFDVGEFTLERFEHASRYYQPWSDLITEELEFFFDLAHYQSDNGNTRSLTRIQPADLTLWSAVRRQWAQISNAPIYFNAMPVDRDTDPDAAELVKRNIERVIHDPRLMYKRKRRRAIMGALVGRQWYLAAEWRRDVSDYGDAVFRLVDPRQAFPEPGYQDIHDPACPAFYEYRELTRDELERLSEDEGWDIEGLPDADDARENVSSGSDPSLKPGQVRLTSDTGAGAPGTELKGRYGFVVAWYRSDPEAIRDVEPAGSVPLDKSEQYMKCPTCGWQDHMADRDEAGELPMYGQPCPHCAAKMREDALTEPDPDAVLPIMERVDLIEEEVERARYPHGRHVVVHWQTRRVVRDGAWPYEKPDGGTLRSFPYMQVRCHEDVRWMYGNSETSIHWRMQLILDGLLRFAYEQMSRNVDVIVAPWNGLVDAKGRTFRFTDLHGQVAYARDAQTLDTLRHFQGSGIPSGWPNVYQAILGSIQSNLATGELNLTAERSKDIPVGTVNAIVESGNVPADDKIAAIREEEGIFLGVVADIYQSRSDLDRYIRYMGEDGQAAFALMSRADLRSVDIIVSAEPSLTMLDAAKMKSVMGWVGMMPPEMQAQAWKVVGRFMGIDQSVVREFEKLMPAPVVPGMGIPGAGPVPTAPANGMAPTPRPELMQALAAQGA